MSGTASTLDGEQDLQFDGTTLTQNNSTFTLPNTPLGGFVSNLNSYNLYDVNQYPKNFNYTGETIQAIAFGQNVGSIGAIQPGQLCAWNYDLTNNIWGFDIVIGGGGGLNTYMLAIALEQIPNSQTGTFLLKGFVSTTHLDISGSVRSGSPLYIQYDSTPGPSANSGRMTDPASSASTTGHIWRCVGYIITNTGLYNPPSDYHVIRFDPSTDYITL